MEHYGLALKGVYNYVKYLRDYGFPERMLPVIKTLPDEFGNQPLARVMINDVLPPKIWPKKSIVYMAHFGNPHFEKWDARSLEKGIGGSETAVIRLSKEWVKAGYTVAVYCDTEKEAVYDGVRYIPFWRVNWNDHFDTIILWRSPHLIKKVVHYNHLYMDLHDIASPLDWSKERWKKVDKIFVKSKYHRNNLPDIPDEKFVIISNGMDL